MKHFCAYPDWVALTQSIQLGFPAGAQPLFLIEDAFNRLTITAEASVRADLSECECIEQQMRDARKRFAVQKVGEVVMNPNEISSLRGEMLWWVTRLVDDLGVISNPYSQMMYNSLGNAGSVNARVIG